MTDHDVLYKYVSKNILFVANAAPKASGEIGTATPEEASLVIYIIDTVTGRILHRMTHHGCQGPVHAVSFELPSHSKGVLYKLDSLHMNIISVGI